MAGIYCVIYLLNGCIRDEDELHRYYGFANFCTFSAKQTRKNANKFDSFLLKKQYGECTYEYVYGRIVQNINLMCEKNEKVLLFGAVEAAKLDELYKRPEFFIT